MLKRFWQEESGATAIEYGLIAAFMGTAMVTSFLLLRGEYVSLFTTVETGVVNANN